MIYFSTLRLKSEILFSAMNHNLLNEVFGLVSVSELPGYAEWLAELESNYEADWGDDWIQRQETEGDWARLMSAVDMGSI